MPPKILLADDHSMIRKGIKILCEHNLGYKGVEEVTNCNQLMRSLATKKFTHLILDINLSDGNSLEILPNIRSLYPELRIIVLSMQPAEIYTRAMHRMGISQYIAKSAPEEETILQLRQFLSDDHSARTKKDAGLTNPFDGFTTRELQVLHYLLKGMGSVAIGKALNIKWNTVSTVKKSIYSKTNTENILQLKELASLFGVS